MTSAPPGLPGSLPRIHLIYARARNGVIGKNNKLPWHLPEDLAHFKKCTLGCPVIMGRNTWESLPERFRPLPGRKNIVITRQAQFQAPGAECAPSLEMAISMCANHSDVWVIGGAQIYALAVSQATSVVVTEIDADFDGDAYAPELGPQWVETTRMQGASTNGLQYSFVTYKK